ncbi:MAG: OadG family protein [Lachnospiraceae bacterium]|nr:OadG family protein [Lachnospiraceae bacterium]
MKKHLIVLGMIISLLGITACGNNSGDTANASTMDQQSAIDAATTYVDGADGLISQGLVTADDVITAGASYGWSDEFSDTMGAAVENFYEAKKDLGDIQEIKDITFEEDTEKGVVTIKSVIVGSELDPKGDNRTADCTITFVKKRGSYEFDSMLTNVKLTTGELFTNAGMNTLLGMGTVFAVLIILMIIISGFKIIYNMQNKPKKTKDVAKTAEDTVAQIIENEEAQDDTELIAVISAAIAAYEGSGSTDGYIVRSVRRRF